jgi:hypothetical protein
VFDDLRSGALVPILSDFLPKRFSIDAFYPHREHLPAKVRTFFDLVAGLPGRNECDRVSARISAVLTRCVPDRMPLPAPPGFVEAAPR